MFDTALLDGTGWTLKTSGTDYAVWDRTIVDVPIAEVEAVVGVEPFVV